MQHFRERRQEKQHAARARTGQRLNIHLLYPILVRFACAVPACDDATVAEAPVADDLPDAEARPAGNPPRHPA